MQKAVGVRPGDKLLQFAIMSTPAQAKDLGMIDDVVPRYKLEMAAEEKIRELLKCPDAGRAETKRLLRHEFLEGWKGYMVGEAEGAWQMLAAPQTVAKLKAVLEGLRARASSKL